MKFRTFIITALALTLLVGGVAVSAQSVPPQVATTGRIRLIHASPGTPNVDVYLGRSNRPIATNLAFGASTGFIELPVNTYGVSIRPAGAPPETAPIVTGAFVNSAGFAANIVIVGQWGRTGSRGPLVMEVPVNFDPSYGWARVQVIHASPDTPQIDLWSNNTIAMDGLLYGDGLFTGISFAPGSYNFAIARSNKIAIVSQPSPVYVNLPNTPLAPNTLYTIIAIGMRENIHSLVLVDPIPLPPPPTATPLPTWTPTPVVQ